MLGFICDGSKLCSALPVFGGEIRSFRHAQIKLSQKCLSECGVGGLDLLGFMFDCVEVSVLNEVEESLQNQKHSVVEENNLYQAGQHRKIYPMPRRTPEEALASFFRRSWKFPRPPQSWHCTAATIKLRAIC
jgi:hypothetical protein